MSVYSIPDLKNRIDTYIKTNGIKSITGALLNTILNDATDSLKNYSDDEIANAIANLINSSPSTLDTLDELASALGDDPNFSTTILNLISQKVSSSDLIAPVGWKFVHGVIRNTGSGWFLITSGGHTPLNVDSVSNTSTTITIDYTSLGATAVGSFVVAPDEDFVGIYDAGASVGLTAATIQISNTTKDRITALITHTGSGNFTSNNGSITPTYNTSTGVLTLTHSSYSADDNIPELWNLPDAVGKETIFQNSSGSISGTSTAMKLFNLNGTQKTLANPEIYRFYYTRKKVALKQNIQNPNNVVSSTGNFWFMGIFKI